MSEGSPKKKEESAQAFEVSGVAPMILGSGKELDVQEPLTQETRAELKNKLRAVIVNIDHLTEQQAIDAGERALTASAKEMKGVSGFFKRMWTHTIAREYYRQKHISKARESIRESGNLHGAEFEHPVGKESHEETTDALVERFTQDYEETLHKGETRKVINREGQNGLNVKGELTKLMKDYASGKVSDADFAEAKKQIMRAVVEAGGGKKDSMYADNLLEIAKNVKQLVAQGESFEALDLDLDLVLGQARDSIGTEAKHNAVDKLIERAKKTKLGVLVNESTLASGIAIAAGIFTTVSKRMVSSRLAALGTLGATAALSGGLIGYAENKRTKEDRAQHAREMAQGRTLEENSPRREEMNKYIHEMRESRGLASSIREAASEKNLSPEGIVAALAKIADAEARIRLMDREKIDLLSYSDPTRVERERFDLDMARAQAKAELRKMKGAQDLPEGKSFDETLEELVTQQTTALTQGEGGIEERNKQFNKMKTKRVAHAALMAVGVGLVLGSAAQEAMAFANDDQTGLVEHFVKGKEADHGQPVHTTWAEGLRRYGAGLLGIGDTPPTTEEINTTVTAAQYLEDHKLGTQVNRDGWYDNDTPKPVFDKNELKLWWGGDKNTGIDANGNYTFSVKQMMPEGSYHNGLKANAQELLKEGKLKMLLSLSQGTQAHPVELNINPDGTVSIDPKSEVGKLFFSEKGGKAQFLGRYAEVAEMTGTKEGVNHVRLLATYEGKGVDTVPDVIKKETPGLAPDDYMVDLPPIIPIYGRKPLEKLNGKKGPPPFLGMYGRGDVTKEMREADARKLSPRLRQNPKAVLDAQQESEEYLARQSKEFLAQINELADQVEPMGRDCKLAICIPAAGHQEGENIERTLSAYLNQTARADEFELVVFVNQPDRSPKGEPIKSDGTLDKINKFKKEHPEINIRVMNKVLPLKDARIGNIRKMLSDAMIARSLKRGGTNDLIMVSNDADLKGVAPEYIKNFIDKFEQEPKIDAVMGQLDWDPESYVRNPLVHIGTRLFQYVAVQHRKALRGIESSGANFAYRSSMYTAVGGYETEGEQGEDVDFGRRIIAARGAGAQPIAYGGARVSRVYTSSRRAEKAIKDGLSPIEQWVKGFSAFDDAVRKVKWEDTGEAPDYDDPAVVKKLIGELENIINRTLPVVSRWWDSPVYAAYERRALGWIGIKYEVVGPRQIRITDASALIAGLKAYKEEALNIMDKKTGKPAKTRKIKPQEKPPEPPKPEAPEPPAPEAAAVEIAAPVPAEAPVEPSKAAEAPVADTEAKVEAEEKPQPKVAEAVEAKEGGDKVPMAEVQKIFKSQLEKNRDITMVNGLKITEGADGPQLDIDIDTKGGRAMIKGVVAAEGGKLVIKNLDVKASFLIKSRVEKAFSDGFGAAVAAYFEKQKGKAVSDITITNEGLVVTFGEKAVKVEGPEKRVEPKLGVEVPNVEATPPVPARKRVVIGKPVKGQDKGWGTKGGRLVIKKGARPARRLEAGA